MVRPAIFLLIAAIGFPLGYFGRGALEPTPDRARALLALFTTHCLPIEQGKPAPPTDGLIAISGTPGEKIWADPVTKLALIQHKKKCLVSDFLVNLSSTEREKFERAVVDFQPAAFPDLQLDPRANIPGWALMKAWTKGAALSPARQGLLLFRAMDHGDAEDATDTVLSINFPTKTME